jgi:hypothetical protein
MSRTTTTFTATLIGLCLCTIPATSQAASPLSAPSAWHLASAPSGLSNETSPSKPTLTWDNALASALALSKDQNGGVAQVSRNCPTARASCDFAVLFKMQDGLYAIMRLTVDRLGQLVRREFCDFDRLGEARTCIDWDTGETHREQKNVRGEWITASDQ